MDFKQLKESLTLVNVLGYALGIAAVITMHYHFYAIALGLALLVAKCWMHVSRKDAAVSKVSVNNLITETPTDTRDNMTGSIDLRTEVDNEIIALAKRMDVIRNEHMTPPTTTAGKVVNRDLTAAKEIAAKMNAASGMDIGDKFDTLNPASVANNKAGIGNRMSIEEAVATTTQFDIPSLDHKLAAQSTNEEAICYHANGKPAVTVAEYAALSAYANGVAPLDYVAAKVPADAETKTKARRNLKKNKAE